ncbi:hypothetical protein AK830_g2533 [Neonectria ditissima]|uniref:Uncharacterized protein n=1 Tax=Neonectria ditissima TaxID=78410 RepID=A0A0P7BVM9_9HYPO|nr:hypothetical protein AK830_g2533 [Neonectria ditissima]
MASSFFLPRVGIIFEIFLVVGLFLLTPASSAAVDLSLKLSWSQEAPPSYQRPRDLSPRVFSRDDSSTCALEEYSQCGSQVPDDFCCPNDSQCMVIASNTTIVCCPKGVSCDAIQPIVCDVALQDISNHPDAPIHTLALDKSMKRCGSACCPFGYVCRDGERCQLDDNQDGYDYLVPESVSEPSSSTSTPVSSTALALATSEVSSTTIPEPSSTSTGSTEPSNSDDGEEDKEKGKISPAGVVTACTVGGVCCLAGLGIFIWLKWFRKRPDSPNTPSHESWGYFSTPGGSTKQLYLARGPDDKFVVTPSTAGFSPPPIPQAPGRRDNYSPVELPATPVSLCMWMDLEDASVEEPRLAYVLPAKQPAEK